MSNHYDNRTWEKNRPSKQAGGAKIERTHRGADDAGPAQEAQSLGGCVLDSQEDNDGYYFGVKIDPRKGFNKSLVEFHAQCKRNVALATIERAQERIDRASNMTPQQERQSLQRRSYLATARAKRLDVIGRWTVDDVYALLKLQKKQCACCSVKLLFTVFDVDHIVPLCKGGENTASNLQLLCKPCNIKKIGRDPIEFMQSRGFLL